VTTATVTGHLDGSTAAATIQIAAAGDLPPGVTLRPIDGGPTYYADNGFTFAHNAGFTFAHNAGWDDPAFFPIGQDYSFYPSNSPTTFKDLGLNFTHRVTSDASLATLRNAGIWVLPSPGEYSGTPAAETIGFHIEEPATWSDITSQVSGLGSLLTGRLLQVSGTANWFQGWMPTGTPGGAPQGLMNGTVATGRHLDIPSADIYWFAASTTGSANKYGAAYMGALLYGLTTAGDLSHNLTADQMARGSNYGDMVDQIRGWVTTHPAPIAGAYIECEDGLVGSGARRITPPEFNWAVWSSLVHGARWLLYFGTTSNFGTGGTFGFSQTALPGQQVSMYAQAKATNALVKQLAPVLNSPFALGYATVTPAGYTFPTPHLILAPGIDVMAKYSGGQFYVFATTRNSESAGPTIATFKTADGYTGPVTVIGENRTVQATAGVFADTFQTAATVHIYQIP
jgi:hypothetical protein